MVKIISFSLLTKEDVQEMLDKSMTTVRQDMKKDMEEQKKDYERYMGALMEDSNEKFAILAENLASQMDRLRENDIMLDRHSDAIFQSDARLKALEGTWKKYLKTA